MTKSKQWMLPMTGFGVAALVLVLATPRAAHAVAAALVQVTNTASNPAVTQDTSHMASQMVHLSCFGEVNGSSSCILFSPSGETGSIYRYYTVPAGQSLVVTSVDLIGGGLGGGVCPGALGVYLNFTGNIFASTGWYWQLTAGAGTTTHFTYPPGFAVSGTTLTGLLVGSSNASCYAIAHIYGYLTAN